MAFVCEGALVGEDDNTASDVYLRDLKAGNTILISREAVVGTRGDGDSNLPSIDNDGTHIAFTTEATNFGDGATPGNREARIYVRTLGGQNNTPLTLVSRADGATGADAVGSSQSPSISADGSRVAFETSAPLAGATDNNGADDIYFRDLKKKMTVLVSRADGATGAVGDHQSIGPLISRDGGIVAFSSQATNLDPTPATATPDFDAYRRCLIAGSADASSMSQTDAGVKGDTRSRSPPASTTTACRVAFLTAAGPTSIPRTTRAPRRDSSDVYVNTQQGHDARQPRATAAGRRAAGHRRGRGAL